MRTFNVLLSKTESGQVQIEAESAEEAEDIAFERFMHCEIELAGSGIPGEVNISVTEADAEDSSVPDMIQIYWADLTPSKQAEILAAFGDNCNYDAFPIVEIPIAQEDESDEV